MTGQRFGRLVVVCYTGSDKHHKSRWDCLCDCGKTINVETGALRSENTKSCGCSRLGNVNVTHGKAKTRIYKTWANMKNRTGNPNTDDYSYYGERGITLCDEWQEFEVFYAWAIKSGYSGGLTIDRIDNNGNYTPQNCRWVNQKIQCNNRRSNNVITYNGETKTLGEWAEQFGLNRSTIYRRLNSGWSIEKVLETPSTKNHNKSNR